MKTCPTTKPLPIEEQVPAFEKDLANADTMRAATLTRLQGLLSSKARHTDREQELIAAERGKDDLDAVMLKAEVASSQLFVRELRAESDRATTATLVADKRTWILHGFVRNQVLEGQSDLTVAMFDGANRWVEALGHTCTDGRGYFQLCFTAGKEAQIEQWREVFVRVSDAKRQELYCDKKPMSVVLGEVRYREIIIGGDTAVCPPPCDAPSPKPGPNELPPEKPTSRKAGAKKKASKKAKKAG